MTGPTAPRPLWDLPDPGLAEPGTDLIALGGGLDPGTLITAYSRGLFPMDVDLEGSAGGDENDNDDATRRHALGWWSPDPRGVLYPGDLRVSRSLAKSVRRFPVSMNRCFEQVMRACADPSRPQGWITEEFIRAYVRLHDMGFAHSVEVWEDGELVGGLYGVEVGGLFAGESMFHHRRDASKVALVHLVTRLTACPGDRVIDVQWRTDHLASLGVREIPRESYLRKLPSLLALGPCLGERGR